MHVIFAPDAVQDLEDIWEYIAEDSVEAADRFVALLYQSASKLAASPRMGHTREDLAGDRPLLFWPVGNYLILYRLKLEAIEIVAIAHGKRDIPAFLRKRGIS